MRVRMSLCAVLRDQPGGCEGDLEVAEGATVVDVAREMGLSADLPLIAVVNGRHAPAATALTDGDRVYLFLPLSGG